MSHIRVDESNDRRQRARICRTDRQIDRQVDRWLSSCQLATNSVHAKKRDRVAVRLFSHFLGRNIHVRELWIPDRSAKRVADVGTSLTVKVFALHARGGVQPDIDRAHDVQRNADV